MQWLRRCSFIVSIGLGVSVLALVVHTFWLAAQPNPPLLGQRVQDLQILVIILLALSSLYTVVFLLSPTVSDRILRRQADLTVRAVKNQLAASIEEFRQVKEEFRRIMLGNEKLMRQLRSETAEPSRQTRPVPQAAPPDTPPETRAGAPEPVSVAGPPRVVDEEVEKIYQAVAIPGAPHGDNSSIAYLKRAIGTASHPAAAAELHYTLGCVLTRQGELDEALREIQMAFVNKSAELDQKLTKDTEEGGPLYNLASRQPYDQVILDLLMDVSVGA